MKHKLTLQRNITTPLGRLNIALDTSDSKQPKYQSIDFKAGTEVSTVFNTEEHELLDLAALQLQQYFKGQRHDFSDLMPYLYSGGTKFQRQVWQALLDIPYGETCSYGDISQRINNPKAVRAVGAANGKNPLAIVVPCHRVIGANGTLTGYAGGLEKKQWLLQFEQQQMTLL